MSRIHLILSLLCTVGSELYPTAKVLEIPTLNYNGLQVLIMLDHYVIAS